jgi:hypothetical protein
LRDLALPTLASSTTLLAIYAAGLIFVAQHVADRYTPVLYPVVVRKVGFVWLGLLTTVAFASLVLAMIKASFWANVADAALLVLALLLTVLGLYRTFRDAADRKRMLGMVNFVSGENRLTALRDLTWTSASRGDVTSTEFLLEFSPYHSKERADLVDWITQYSQLLEQPWMRQAVLNSLTAGDFDEEAAKQLGPVVIRLLVHCLDHEWFDSARDVILGAVRTVEGASEFTSYHMYMIFDVGFNLHYIGEEGRASERHSQRSPEALKDLQDLFVAKLTSVRRSVIGKHSRGSVTQYCYLLQRLAEVRIGPMFVSSQVWDIVEDAYKQDLLEQDALESLASVIGEERYDWERGFPSEEEAMKDLDRRAAHLALYIVALGQGDQVGRMMGNAHLSHGKRMPERLAMHNNLGEDIYARVAKELGYRSWPK